MSGYSASKALSWCFTLWAFARRWWACQRLESSLETLFANAIYSYIEVSSDVFDHTLFTISRSTTQFCADLCMATASKPNHFQGKRSWHTQITLLSVNAIITVHEVINSRLLLLADHCLVSRQLRSQLRDSPVITKRLHDANSKEWEQKSGSYYSRKHHPSKMSLHEYGILL